MARRQPLLETIRLQGLTPAPPQVLGAIRLVPLLRDQVRDDLRLALRGYQNPLAMVKLEGPLNEPGIVYGSYIPHALVASWSDDGAPAAAFGGQLVPRDGNPLRFGVAKIHGMEHMARREAPNRLRFLPLHVAMEGFLGLCFGGPDIAWSEYSNRVLSRGLSPRFESAYGGRALRGVDEALRLFEIHERQVGLLLFVADALASAFVTPHPDDYRLLHETLLEDFFCDLIQEYSFRFDSVAPAEVPKSADPAGSIAELRAMVDRMRRDWAAFHVDMSRGVLGRKVRSSRVYHLGPFQLERFLTDLDPREENHIGEAIVREDGTLEYLKTYRLSAAQTRRAYLLQQLAAQHWNLPSTAAELRCTPEELMLRLDKAGFGYLLHQHVLDAARKRLRTRA